MAVMQDADRFSVWASFMRREQLVFILLAAVSGVTKAQLRAGVDAADQWASDNAVSYNSALPAPVRNNLTANQKTALLVYVLLKRSQVDV